MMFLLTCDKKLTKSQFSPTHASTKRKITGELKHNAHGRELRLSHDQDVVLADKGRAGEAGMQHTKICVYAKIEFYVFF